MNDVNRWAALQARLENKVISHCDECGHLTLFDQDGNCQSCPKNHMLPVEWEEWFTR